MNFFFNFFEAVGVEFDHLITKRKVEESDRIEDIINPQTRFEVNFIITSCDHYYYYSYVMFLCINVIILYLPLF
jgi:hypothetical protein